MPDMMGSLVHAGGYPLQQALDTKGTDGARLGDELRRIGYAGDTPRGTLRPHAFVELHIEQGPQLEAEGFAIGWRANRASISNPEHWLASSLWCSISGWCAASKRPPPYAACRSGG